MSKAYLMIEVEPITMEHQDGRWILALGGDDELGRTKMFATQIKWSRRFGVWVSTQFCPVKFTPTHFLPKGMPTPLDLVTVFETQIERFYLSGNNDYELGIGYPSEVIPPEGTKVGVFRLSKQ
jgi:hypothetical protein